ncbi:MAG: peptidylprolyl isomerase [Candidatus Krumholzibacteria bacterium]|nr:peptidylprolyl isomerase [Candidatus Krumholzibacteria bacterium]
MIERSCATLMLALLIAAAVPAGSPAGEAGKPASNPTVVIKTNLGDITVELYPDKAPITVKNFLGYIEKKFYDGTIFHRVIDGFMIQGGGFMPDMTQKEPGPPIKNEASNGLKNERYTIAMARTNIVDSATAQFYINVADNAGLDHKDTTPQGYGYAVFGKVIAGTDVVDRIRAVKTATKGMYKDVPVKPVVINKIRILEIGEE